MKTYNKKHKNELTAVVSNLHDYQQTLKALGSPQYITGKYVHKEPKGIKALDESGERKLKNLQATRLYVYPDVENKVLHLLMIGSKNTQKKNIKLCVEIVKEIRG